MNAAHLHVILNHIPVIGIPLGAGLLLYGLVRKSEEVKRASLLVFVIVAVITIPTYLAGQAAEDMVEHLPGVNDDTIHNHEDAATIGLIVTSVLGVLSLTGLALSVIRGALGFFPTIFFLVLAFGVSAWLGRVANLGGKIRHPEFSDGASIDDDHDREGNDDGGRQRRRRNRGGRDR